MKSSRRKVMKRSKTVEGEELEGEEGEEGEEEEKEVI